MAADREVVLRGSRDLPHLVAWVFYVGRLRDEFSAHERLRLTVEGSAAAAGGTP